MTVSLVRIFVPSNQQMWKRFRHIYFVLFFGWWNCLNGTNGKDINVNVKAVNIDNVPKRRQTLSLFSQVSLKDAITWYFYGLPYYFFSRKWSLFLCTFAIILQCWLSRRTESGSKSEGIKKEIITKLSKNRFMSSLEPHWRFRGTWNIPAFNAGGPDSIPGWCKFFLENVEMQFIQSLKC